ncbi:hypothetical protein C0J52_05122 [Blattella germanica]|nr:hypothetical protein C0J52_05122 [Blattella germanica]
MFSSSEKGCSHSRSMFSHHDERESFSGLHTYDTRNNRDLVVARHRLTKTSNSHIVMSITLFNKVRLHTKIYDRFLSYIYAAFVNGMPCLEM